MSGPPDLSPDEARERWLNKQRVDCSSSTISTYHYRLKLFVEWCRREGIDRMADVSGWDLEEYEMHRRSKEVAAATLHNELKTIRQWLEYLGGIGVVDADLHQAVDPPDIASGEESDDTKLTAEAAAPLLEHYRSGPDRGSRAHTLLELAWYTGARVGGLRALDVRDVDLEDGYLWFAHRPETDTPLKNAGDGQRAVALPGAVLSTIEAYLDDHRIEIEDSAGRQPLLTGQQGRPLPGTLRDWMYQATIPCVHGPCPHGRDRPTCSWTTYNGASNCPSSRSPHQVRTGAITWMLDCGLPVDVVADRVNATPEVISRHYDKQDAVTEMERRRRPHLTDLRLDS
jgi:site-specific recombinase XerD